MKLFEYTITVPSEYTTVSLFPAVCIHRDDPGHSPSHWTAYKQDVKATPHGYAIFLGDYFTWLRTHARQWVKQYPHDENSFDAMHDWRHQMTGDFVKELAPFKDRIIGMSVGNHNHTYPDGTNDTQEMCRLLGVTYLEHTALTRLVIKTPNRPAHKVLTMLTLHGEGVGGGATAGGDINAMFNKGVAWDVDIVILGHNHQKNVVQTVHLGLPPRGELRIKERDRVFIRAGCFVRGYTPGCTTYAERNLMKPTAIGHVRLDIEMKKPYAKDRYQKAKEEGKLGKLAHTSNLQHIFKVTY